MKFLIYFISFFLQQRLTAREKTISPALPKFSGLNLKAPQINKTNKPLHTMSPSKRARSFDENNQFVNERTALQLISNNCSSNSTTTIESEQLDLNEKELDQMSQFLSATEKITTPSSTQTPSYSNENNLSTENSKIEVIPTDSRKQILSSSINKIFDSQFSNNYNTDHKNEEGGVIDLCE